MRLRDRIKMFMAGRNGLDSLFYFLFVLYLVLYGFNFIFKSPWLYYAQLILLVLALFRIFSKNVEQRRKEADKFSSILAKIYPNSEINKRRLLEGRTHSFHECPYCGAVLRFERKRGKFNVTCPKCNNKITIRNWI